MREPPGGHQFPERGTTITGERFLDVVKKLSDFRINNGIPLGDPTQEILIRYAEKWPYLVENDDSGMPQIVSTSNKSSWKEWVFSIWSHPPKLLITSKEASARWEICLECPFNKKLSLEVTGEDAEIKRRTFLLRRGQEVPASLHFCSLHGMDLSVGCFLEKPKDFSISEPIGEYEKCWVK